MFAFLVGFLLSVCVSFGFQPIFHTDPYTIIAAFVELPALSWLPMAVNIVVYLGVSLILELILYRDSHKRRSASWGSALALIFFLVAQF